jgi:hypothetical protein
MAASSPSRSSAHGAAGPLMRGHLRVPLLRSAGIGDRDFRVDVEQFHRLVASRVARVGLQEAVQFRQLFISASPGSRAGIR